MSTNPFLQVTREHNERREMEKAFITQASKVEEVFQQNRDLAQRLVDLEKLWVEEERFTVELRGRVEALQVRSPLWGSCTLMIMNVSRTRSASVGCLEARRFPSR